MKWFCKAKQEEKPKPKYVVDIGQYSTRLRIKGEFDGFEFSRSDMDPDGHYYTLRGPNHFSIDLPEDFVLALYKIIVGVRC